MPESLGKPNTFQAMGKTFMDSIMPRRRANCKSGPVASVRPGKGGGPVNPLLD